MEKQSFILQGSDHEEEKFINFQLAHAGSSNGVSQKTTQRQIAGQPEMKIVDDKGAISFANPHLGTKPEHAPM